MDEAIKRSNIRYLIDLEVKVEPKEKAAFGAKVRDYCLSGMYLTLLRENNVTPLPVPVIRGETIIIEFAALNGKRHRVQAEVAHTVAGGFGLRFATISDESLDALVKIAAMQQSQTAKGPVLAGEWQSEGRAGLLLLLKDILQRHLVGLFNNFHETLVDAIFERASRPRSINEQNHMFEALDYLNRERAASFQKIYSEIVTGFDSFISGKMPSSHLVLETPRRKQKEGLSLIDNREFEEWLWASSTVAVLEAEHEEQMFNLNRRLASLQGLAIDNENNPVGAAAISHAFQELISQFLVADSVKELVITTFQQAIRERFGDLIHEINQLLIGRGILPEVKRDMKIVRLGPNSDREPIKPISIGQSTGSEKRHEQPSVATRSAPPLAAPQARDYMPPLKQEGTGGLHQIRSLLRANQALPTGVIPSAGNGDVPSGDKPANGWYGPSELTAALSTIEHQISAIHANRNKGETILAQLKSSLVRMGADPNKVIPLAQQESIEVIDNLMGSVHEDPIVADEARPWLEQLEIPLLKTAIHDVSLIENRDHPATHFLNRLDAIGKSLATQENEHAHATRQEISTLIDQVKEKSHIGEPAFDQALSRLEDIHSRMRHHYEASVTELVRRCNAEYELDCKRNALLRLLDGHFGGQKLPVIILELMDAGWKNLLLRSFVREGAEGRIFRRFLEVIDQGIAHLTGDSSRVRGRPWPGDTLLDLIPRGLRQVPVGEDLIDMFMVKMTPQFSMASAMPGSIELRTMPRIMEITEERRQRARHALVSSLNVAAVHWNKAEDSVRSMNSGDMITLTDANNRKRVHRLVWIAPDQSRYLFVDGEGHLSSDMTLDKLTSLLLQERVSIIEGWDVPLMDRATYAMLLSIHQKLLSQSNSDPLTGVLNRRAFHFELEKVLDHSRMGKFRNILCYLDLDHFSQVNNMSTHQEGDRVLKEVAIILRQQVPDKSLIGRLGGDEFAILMPNMSRSEGLMMTRRLQQAIVNHKFQYNNRAYHLAASYGVTEINEHSEGATQLLTAVENACRSAKGAGHDSIEILHESTGDLMRREQLIGMVGLIRESMGKGRTQLACQRILPVNQREMDQPPYYEILLRMQDIHGQAVSHEQLIQAAEIYNLTLDVDQWVVLNAIDWLEQRQAASKQLPVLSINLSGRSVNNKTFMDAIVGRIIKCTIPRNHLCFEITETAAIGNMGQAIHFINRLKRLGCSFSLDDFGTGVSSYSYLKALPVDYIKISGAFVSTCHEVAHDFAVVKSINELAHAMGKKTIAEFVENEDILARLHEIGVDYAQGYGIEIPLPLSQLN